MVTMWTLHSDPGVTRTSGDRFARIAARTWSFLSPRRLKPLTAEVENEGEERYYIENATQNPYRRDPKDYLLGVIRKPWKGFFIFSGYLPLDGSLLTLTFKFPLIAIIWREAGSSTSWQVTTIQKSREIFRWVSKARPGGECLALIEEERVFPVVLITLRHDREQ